VWLVPELPAPAAVESRQLAGAKALNLRVQLGTHPTHLALGDALLGYILDIARNGQSGVPLGSATVLVMSRRREAVSASGLDYLACLRARTGYRRKRRWMLPWTPIRRPGVYWAYSWEE
jgi:hypothetical protein